MIKIELRNIIKDAIYYPSKDWMKVIILGFLSLISLIGVLTELNLITLVFLVLVPLPLGYLFRILKTSFDGSDELPDLNKWKNMYSDGIRVIIVTIVYAIPLILIIMLFNPDQILGLNLSKFSIFSLIDLFYKSTIQIIIFIIIGLVEIVAYANMALYRGELSAAFRFREIFNRISMIGWRKYLITYALIWAIGCIIVLISIITLTIVIGIIIIPLIIAPYFIILGTRLIALIFASSES